jgi:hypothetical protein
MTKLRVPHTWAEAATRVAGELGYAEAGLVVGRSERTIYEWANPDTATRPSLEQMIALDAAYIAAGGEGAPFLAAHAHQLDLTSAALTADRSALVEAVQTTARECGEAIDAALTVSAPNASPIETHRALVQANEAHQATGALVQRLTSFLPAGAGPSAGKALGEGEQ